MLFNSLHFVFFFIVISIAYYKIPHSARWMLLLAASCYFYMAFIPIFILILVFTIIIDYLAGIFIEKEHGKRKKFFLICSLVANIGVLAVFKYYNFLNENITFLIQGFHLSNPVPYLSIILPIGLSFHTFQAMSYTIEVYRGNQKAEKHFGIYALYVMFYPQLVAGPIERPQNILHQLKKPVSFDEERFTSGLQIMVWGFFKKVVIADRLAVLVNIVYANPSQYSGLTNAVAALFFSFQIYCDFSGYSDIAIGAAKTLGIDLMKNFNRPYLSKSITEFWQRWHISLSSWFRDYLYIPLGGNRKGKFSAMRNMFIVFLLSGLWHGANWTFVIWGSIHGILVLFERITNIHKIKTNNRIVSFLRIGVTFFFVSCAWVFFRAESFGDAISVFKSIIMNFHINKISIGECILLLTNDNSSFSHFLVCIFVTALMILIEIRTSITFKPVLSGNSKYQFVFYSCIVFLIMFLGYFKSNAFIYFQF